MQRKAHVSVAKFKLTFLFVFSFSFHFMICTMNFVSFKLSNRMASMPTFPGYPGISWIQAESPGLSCMSPPLNLKKSDFVAELEELCFQQHFLGSGRSNWWFCWFNFFWGWHLWNGKTQKQKQQYKLVKNRSSACIYIPIIDFYLFCSNYNLNNILPQSWPDHFAECLILKNWLILVSQGES